MEKINDIQNKYEGELLNIKNKLNHLEEGRIYEITGAKMDGYLATNIIELKKMLNDLIYKIKYNKESDIEALAKALNNIEF